MLIRYFHFFTCDNGIVIVLFFKKRVLILDIHTDVYADEIKRWLRFASK